MFVNVADDATLKKARRSVAWCDEQEVTRVFYIVEYDTLEDFVRHPHLKPLPDRKLRSNHHAFTMPSPCHHRAIRMRFSRKTCTTRRHQHSVDRCSSVRLTCTSFCLLSTSRAFSRKMYPNAAWSR